MTDKEIMIDGVDVSKCPDLLKEYLPFCYCSTLDKENQEASCAGCFCLFKIKQYMNNNKLIEDLRYELKCKEQECEELEERLKRTEEDLKYQCVDCMNVKSDRYRKTLEEIEEIAKSFNKNELCFYKEINECDCCDMGADCNYLRRAKILYIINKAKEKSDG